MKKLKIIIVLLIFIILIIFIVLMNLTENVNISEHSLSTKPLINNNVVIDSGTVASLELNNNITQVTDEQTYMTFQRNIDIYSQIIYDNNSKLLYKMLDTDYIKNNGITENNAISKIKKPISDTSFYKIYEVPINNYRTLIFAFENISNYKITMEIDSTNYTVAFSEYGELYKEYIDYTSSDMPIIKDIDGLIKTEKTIQLNDYNNYDYTEYDYVGRYFSSYSGLIINEKYDIAYSLLKDKSNFNTLNDFIEYINKKNYKNYIENPLELSIKDISENRYVINDNRGVTYTFEIESIGNYKVTIKDTDI